MSDVLWTDGESATLLPPRISHVSGAAARLGVWDEMTCLTPDECDSLAAALVQAANRKRSEDRVRQLEQEGKASK